MTEDKVRLDLLFGHVKCWQEYVRNNDGSVTCMGHYATYNREGEMQTHTADPISVYSPQDAAIVASIGGFK